MSQFIDSLKHKYGEDFFREEVRCDFTITAERKEVWAVLLDMLEKFIEVCKKYNLTYFAMGGTLLGAVRHKGFIPWDDDMDIGMPREDYDKLLEIGEKEFSYPYFFQTPHTDPYYGFTFAKIRNSETTFISPKLVSRGENMNMGIFLDIFPMNLSRRDKDSEIREKLKPLIMKNFVHMKKNAAFLEQKDIEQIEMYYDENNNMADTFDEIQKIMQTYSNDENVDMISNYCFVGDNGSKYIHKKEYFESFTQLSFEHLELNVPTEYDVMLKTTYGDYMQLPPMEKRGVWHDGIFEPRASYKKVIADMMKEN